MTDIERDKCFEELKNQTIDRLLGTEKIPVNADEVQFRDVDYKFNTSKTMYDSSRILDNMNPDMEAFHGHYTGLRDNGYVRVVKEEIPLDAEAPVVK